MACAHWISATLPSQSTCGRRAGGPVEPPGRRWTPPTPAPRQLAQQAQAGAQAPARPQPQHPPTRRPPPATPPHLVGGLLGARGGAVDDRRHAHQRGGQRGGVCEVGLHRGGAPVAQEVGGAQPRPHDAAHFVALVQGAAHHLAAQRAGAADDQDGVAGHWRAAGRGRAALSRRRRAPHAALPAAWREAGQGWRARQEHGAAVGLITCRRHPTFHGAWVCLVARRRRRGARRHRAPPTHTNHTGAHPASHIVPG